MSGCKAVLFAAPKSAEGQPWLWYAPTLKGGVSHAGRMMYFESVLNACVNIEGFDLGEGHKVSPSFFECRELADFVLAHAVK